MADDQQQEEQIQQTPVPLEQTSTNNDMVQSVQELLFKDKSTILVKAAELLILNLQQQEVIMVLKQTLQEASEQKEQMLKDLHDQPVMESLMNNIEAQNQSTRKQLNDKAESINMHMKSNEVLRKQLKKEILSFRSGIEDVKKQIQEKEETGKLQHQAHVNILARVEEVSKQLRSVSEECAKLREENQEKLDKTKSTRSSYEENIKKMQQELLEWENALKQHTEELTIVKQQIAEKVQACRQMLSEKHDIQNISDELKQQFQTEKAKLKESFTAEKHQLDQTLVDKADEYKTKVEELNQKINDLTNIKEQQLDCIAELDVQISQITEQITEVQNQNVKLENEHSMVGSTLNLDSESEGVLVQTKHSIPVNFLSGRPKRQVFTKSHPQAHPRSPSNTDNDHDVSCHLDNEQSSSTI